MIVRSLDHTHLAAVAALEGLCFHAPWSESALELLCGSGGFGLVCLSEEGSVLAYAGVMTVLDEGQLTNVATHPDCRRQGCAAALMTALLEESRVRGLSFLSLEVRESNEAAIALYRKYGFSVAGKRPNFYTHPREAALVMTLTLTRPSQ